MTPNPITPSTGDEWRELTRCARREVRGIIKTLPRHLREPAAALPVTFEHVPSQALMEDGIAADTLGLFVGGEYAFTEQDPLPAQIILFLDTIWDMVEGDRDEFVFEVRTTYLHELGHYLGLDEDDLTDRGLE
jgi:predicted Zn-dependent protease with MMP-like domain